jgi:Ca2+-binding RTX toxin-like protein
MATYNGTGSADFLTGSDADDVFYGNDGDDTVEAGGGSDTVEGGTGNDSLSGGAGDDSFGVYYADFGDDVHDGGAGNDAFLDMLGANTVLGGDGNDLFRVESLIIEGTSSPTGAAGTATGGPGTDTYAIGPNLASALHAGDFLSFDSSYTVTDFAAGPGGDLIDLDILLAQAGDDDYGFPYAGGNPFAASNRYLFFVQSGADAILYYDGDTDEQDQFGPPRIVLTLENTSVSALTADNFVGGFAPDGSAVPGETLVGGAAAESLEGTQSDDSIVGNAGDDTLEGSGGDDVLRGGPGNDVLAGGPGSDTLVGGAGDDRFVVAFSGTQSVATGGGGQDTYLVGPDIAGRGYSVTDFSVSADPDRVDVIQLVQQSAKLEIQSGNANPFVGGNPFDPALGYLRLVQDGAHTQLQWDFDGAGSSEYGWVTLLTLNGVQASSLSAQNFVDGIPPDGSAGAGTVFAGTAGDDSVRGAFFGDALSGIEGNDFLFGNAGADSLTGGPGNDTVIGGIGDDIVRGGAGDDLLEIHLPSALLDFNVDQLGNDTIYGGDGADQISDNYGSNLLDGGGGGDNFPLVISYDDGVTTLLGGAGSDMFGLSGSLTSMPHLIADFTAGAGGDLLGVDKLIGKSALDGGFGGGNLFDLGYLQLTASGSNTLIQWDHDGASGSAAALATQVTLLNVLASSITSDNFTGELKLGTEGDDALLAGPGNDTLLGLGGNDTLDGSSGRDSMAGGSGNDLYRVDDPGDILVEPEVVVAAGAQAIIGLAGVTDTVVATISFSLENIANVENLSLDAAATTGLGNALSNELIGNAHANLLTGLAGDDSILGAAGNDTLQGNQGADTLRGGLGDDELRGGQDGDVVYSGQGDDMALGAFGADELRGGLGNDTVSGGQGNDSLFGGADNDLLQGRLGNDLLTGGAGADTFWFNIAGAADADTVLDFEAGVDKIALDSTAFTAQVFGLNILYDSGSGALSYDADGAGAASALPVATLQGAPALTASDFLVM